jgi:aconitate hydratase
LRNLLVPEKEGGWTIHIPSGERMRVFDAAERYREEDIPLIILAGKQYGAGSSRDWAAKATLLLGVKAVIAESFERIHRSNLIGMGILPLQFMQGESWKSLGLSGNETFDIRGVSEGLYPKKRLTVSAKKDDGAVIKFNVITRLDIPIEVDYFLNGGILQTILRRLIKEK